MSEREANPAVRLEEDRFDGRVVIAALVAALLFSGGMVVWAALELRAQMQWLRPEGWPRVVIPADAPIQIGGLFQTLIEADGIAARLAAAERERLESYGWVDRERGRVRIPIEEAMRIVAAEGER